jgi:hypothetical protein
LNVSGDVGEPLELSPRPQANRSKQPGWAEGLRKLYDSVVAEPLPDSFNDLLKKLDQAGYE